MEPNRRHAAIADLLDAYDIELTENNIEHMRRLVEAATIYDARNSTYGDLWRASGSEDNAFHCRSKVQRMMHATDFDTRTDSARDLINYAVFFIRNLEANR